MKGLMFITRQTERNCNDPLFANEGKICKRMAVVQNAGMRVNVEKDKDREPASSVLPCSRLRQQLIFQHSDTGPGAAPFSFLQSEACHPTIQIPDYIPLEDARGPKNTPKINHKAIHAQPVNCLYPGYTPGTFAPKEM